VTVQPQGASQNSRVNAGLFPPFGFIASAVDFSMMAATQWNCVLIANFAAECTRLRKPQMMGVRWPATADQTRLLGNQFNVIPVANAARCRQR
jgi:hypothetical protein